MSSRTILLIVSGGIAAYKSLELTRRLMDRGYRVRPVMTEGAKAFVTPLSFAAIAGEKVHDTLFSLTDEAEMGHIRLSREADLVVIAPATADLMAKMANGHADDLATTVLLATDKRVMIAPAMNPQMWAHPATQRNLAVLKADGILTVGPNPGDMACGETGAGRMAEPQEIIEAIERFFDAGPRPLDGLRALVTSGPTHEPIDPVRYIANRSSGRQGHAIAHALAMAGAEVTLVSGPVSLPDPPSVAMVRVESAREMLDAALAALPVDIAVCAAAVADWRPQASPATKIKKEPGAPPPGLEMVENPDILARLSAPGATRPRLVIGFAAETGDLVDKARRKLERKGCDWILANDVSAEGGVFGGSENEIALLTDIHSAHEAWPRMSKEALAERLVERIAASFDPASPRGKART